MPHGRHVLDGRLYERLLQTRRPLTSASAMHLSNPTREPYKGKTRQLVVAIDIGTTFTAASFCILQPGFPPKFEEVRVAFVP